MESVTIYRVMSQYKGSIPMHKRHKQQPRWSSPRQGSRRRHWSGHRSHGRGGHRARRGDVRAAVLALLDEQPMHGSEIIKELEARSGGAWRPSARANYPTRQLLKAEGLIKDEEPEAQ